MPVILQTTFWTNTVENFSKLAYSKNGKPVVEINLKDSNYSIASKFRELAKFVKGRESRSLINSDYRYQFYVFQENSGDWIPVVWFDLILQDGTVIRHDKAFWTTLVRKNSVPVPLGKFPHFYKGKRFCIYRENKITSNAFKYIANQIFKRS